MSILLVQLAWIWRGSLIISARSILLRILVLGWWNWYDTLFVWHCIFHPTWVIIVSHFGLITSILDSKLLLVTLIVSLCWLFDISFTIFRDTTCWRSVCCFARILKFIPFVFNFLFIFWLLVLYQFLENLWFL